MIALYHAPPIWLHNLPAGIKLLALALATWTLFANQSPWLPAAALVFAAMNYALLGKAGLRRLALLRPLIPLLVIVFILQYLASDMNGALVSAGRLLAMLLLADLVTLSTGLQAMIDVLNRLLRPLSWLGVRHENISLAVALTIRFVPLVLESWRRCEDAWSARTQRRAGLRLIKPFIADVMRMSAQIAQALDARRANPQSEKPADKKS